MSERKFTNEGLTDEQKATVQHNIDQTQELFEHLLPYVETVASGADVDQPEYVDELVSAVQHVLLDLVQVYEHSGFLIIPLDQIVSLDKLEQDKKQTLRDGLEA